MNLMLELEVNFKSSKKERFFKSFLHNDLKLTLSKIPFCRLSIPARKHL